MTKKGFEKNPFNKPNEQKYLNRSKMDNEF